MKADPKLSLIEQIRSFPPPPPEKVAELMAIREKFIQKRREQGLPEETSIREFRGMVSKEEGRQMMLLLDYSRGHISEEEFLAQGGKW